MDTRFETRSEACLGWRCLNAAQKFGIIFSIVVFFIIVGLLYMYFLGKAKIAYENKDTKVVVGGIRLLRPVSTPHLRGVGDHRPNAVLPISSQFATISAPPAVYYPVMPSYPMHAMAPQMLPTTVPQFSYPLVPAAQHFTPHQSIAYPSFPPPNTSTVLKQQLQETLNMDANLRAPSQPRSPNWFQRIQKAFHLPTGKASTVGTRSPSIVSRPDKNEIVQMPNMSKRGPVGSGREANIDGPPPETVNAPGSEQHKVDQDQVSIDTAAATVYSDDFEVPGLYGMVPSTSSRASFAPNSRLGCNDHNGSTIGIAGNGPRCPKDKAEANGLSQQWQRQSHSLDRGSRDSKRRAWEEQQQKHDEKQDGTTWQDSPKAPIAIHQGGGEYGDRSKYMGGVRDVK